MTASLITETQTSGTTQSKEDARLPAIELDHLCKHFGTHRAVQDLTLTIERGEIFGLLGPNGSGKTTTINMISGLITPTSGSINILGYDIRRDVRQIRQRLGTVPQETALYDELSAWTNMDFHADLFGVPRKEKNEMITRMLELVQLLDRKDSKVQTFSGGMKRRLAIARALLHEPQLIYLDEPTLGVDVQSRRAIWDYIQNLRRRGKTVLITTNYLEEAQALCDRLAIIDHGKLVAIDTPDHLKQIYGGSVIEVQTASSVQALDDLQRLPGVTEVSQKDDVVRITTRGINSPLASIVNTLSQECEIKDITIRESNLDEVFLQLTGTALRD
jgi:ABC-2 type transport system ATP-binding protein